MNPNRLPLPDHQSNNVSPDPFSMSGELPELEVEEGLSWDMAGDLSDDDDEEPAGDWNMSGDLGNDEDDQEPTVDWDMAGDLGGTNDEDSLIGDWDMAGELGEEDDFDDKVRNVGVYAINLATHNITDPLDDVLAEASTDFEEPNEAEMLRRRQLMAESDDGDHHYA